MMANTIKFISLFNRDNNPMTWVVVFSSFLRWGNKGIQCWVTLRKDQRVGSRVYMLHYTTSLKIVQLSGNARYYTKIYILILGVFLPRRFYSANFTNKNTKALVSCPPHYRIPGGLAFCWVTVRSILSFETLRYTKMYHHK